MGCDSDALRVTDHAIGDLRRRLGVSARDVSVVSVEPVQWRVLGLVLVVSLLRVEGLDLQGRAVSPRARLATLGLGDALQTR